MDNDTQPGPELDRMIAEKVMGWQSYAGVGTFLRPCGVIIYTNKSHHNPWSPSTRIDHAWEVAERFSRDGWGFTLDSAPDDHGNWCNGWFFAGIGKYTARALGAPHAICLAALKAVGESHDH